MFQFNNLGNLYHELSNYNDARDIFTKAIEINNDLPEVHNNLGIVFQKLGLLKDAEKSYQKSINLNSNFANTFMNLAGLYHYMNRYSDSINLYQKVLNLDPLNYGLKAQVNIAIYKFLEDDFADCRKYLLESIKIKEKVSQAYKNERVYHNYLNKLLEWHGKVSLDRNFTKFEKLFIIGESHALTSHWINVTFKNKNFLGESYLIKGLKQWHLGNSSKNQYKNKFENIFKSLSKNSNVLFAIGEIDCRLDDGIIKYKNKNSSYDINGIIENAIKII